MDAIGKWILSLFEDVPHAEPLEPVDVIGVRILYRGAHVTFGNVCVIKEDVSPFGYPTAVIVDEAGDIHDVYRYDVKPFE